MQRQANATDAEAQKRQVRLEVVQSERAIYVDRRDSTQRFLEGVKEKRRTTEARQREIRDLSETAAKKKREAVEELLDEMQKVLKAYSEQVRATLKTANEKTRQAVVEAEHALKLASSREMRQVHQLNLLACRLDQVYVLTSQIQTIGDMGSTIGVLRERSRQIMTDQAPLFATTWDDFEKEQNDLIALVDEAADKSKA